MIHRDVKPANILLTQSGQPMLSDFGIAKVLEVSDETGTLTGTGVGIGTPEYMAPEQGLGRAIDHRVDIYSLGIVFYELVTGQKPFKADTPMAVVVKQVNDPLPRPKGFIHDLPDNVEKVIFKAMAKKPEDRYQNMAEFAAALESLGLGKKTTRIETRFQMDRAASGNGVGDYCFDCHRRMVHPNQLATATPTTIADVFNAQQAIALATSSAWSTNIALTPTATSVPTKTPLPTNTSTPAPKPIISAAKRVVRNESFDSLAPTSLFSLGGGLSCLTGRVFVC